MQAHGLLPSNNILDRNGDIHSLVLRVTKEGLVMTSDLLKDERRDGSEVTRTTIMPGLITKSECLVLTRTE